MLIFIIAIKYKHFFLIFVWVNLKPSSFDSVFPQLLLCLLFIVYSVDIGRLVCVPDLGPYNHSIKMLLVLPVYFLY